MLLQICKPYTSCLRNLEYTKVDGRAFGDRDNVCVRYTACKVDVEYEVSPASSTADRVCARYTQCDSYTEYLLRKGNSTSDNVCARKTFCAAQSFRSKYEKHPPVDSTAWNVPGKDAECADISTCPAGQYVYIGANDTADVTCAPCPKGMYKSAGMMSCFPCPGGFYTDELGSTSCKACTECLHANASAIIPSSKFHGGSKACHFANASLCRIAFESTCTSEADAVCMQCPTLIKGWKLDAYGVCTACRQGYYYDNLVAYEWDRCIPCTANFYCPSAYEFQECQVLFT